MDNTIVLVNKGVETYSSIVISNWEPGMCCVVSEDTANYLNSEFPKQFQQVKDAELGAKMTAVGVALNSPFAPSALDAAVSSSAVKKSETGGTDPSVDEIAADAEAKRLEAEKLEAEKKAEAEKLEAEKSEAEKLEAEKLEAEKKAEAEKAAKAAKK